MKLWELASQAVSNGITTTLVAVVDHRGSVPGKTGAMMVVTPDAIVGTVGGGLVEHQWITRARQLDQAVLEQFSHDGKASDSICSGLQIMVGIPLAKKDLPTLQKLEGMEKTGTFGVLELSPAGLKLPKGGSASPGITRKGKSWNCLVTFGRSDKIYIAGGGHVSLALSRVMATLPFRIEVFDTRKDLPTMSRNQWAHSTRVISWDQLPPLISVGPHSWAVIMTHGHRDDETVLRKLIDLDLRYLGLMGSGAKVDQLYQHLRADGISEETLKRVHSPIGLKIQSHTPEEIAVSIAAEIIHIRNKGKQV